MKNLIYVVALLFIGTVANCQERPLSDAINRALEKKVTSSTLYYPRSVKRFYTKNSFEPVWIKSDSSHTFEAMLLLDCIVQYGLLHADYHPDKLTYDQLRQMMEKPQQVSDEHRAMFDITLTDALITFINHLHYGKLNPQYSHAAIDEGRLTGFSAEHTLRLALVDKEFMEVVLGVQPKVKAYTDLQSYMRLVRGQYLDDCYEVPESEVRKVAINMERLRWANFNSESYIHVNIPSYRLTYQSADSSYYYKIMVGKPETKSPLVRNEIATISISPERLSFIPISKSKLQLHGSILQKHVATDKHAITGGSIEVLEARDLATRLLRDNDTPEKVEEMGTLITTRQRKKFKLSKPVPIKVTYLTCVINEGLPVFFDDVYNLDQRLEAALYNLKTNQK